MLIKGMLLALAAATAAQPVQQFDLVCTGAGADTSQGAFTAEDVHLRVDLEAAQWCQEPPANMPNVTPCTVLHPVAEVQPGAIWFEKESAEEKARGLMHWRAVNRETGTYHYVHEGRLIGRIAIVSQCSPAPFSGFPKIETKF